jgi:hypothetical protein
MGRITQSVLALLVVLYLPVTVADAATGNKSRKLRFKDGPVCMCSTGLSEKDIQDALLKRRLADDPDSLPTIKIDEKNQSNVKEEK